MKSFGKRLATGALALCICASTLTGALAYDANKGTTQADALKTLGLFQGTSTGYELDRAPTRIEALIMMLRMMGDDISARYYEGSSPFTDAPTWEGASNYLAYAYEKGLTTGISATTFDPQTTASAQTYVTFMLRALGYDATNAWNNWQTLGKEAGLLTDDVNTSKFMRGDAVAVSYAALNAKLYGTETTLSQSLISQNVFSALALSYIEYQKNPQVSLQSSLGLIACAVYDGVSEYLTPKSLQSTEITQDNMKYYLGVNNLKVVEGLAVEPLMTASAHSVVLARLEDGTNMEQAKTAVKNNVDPRKWICVGVEPENIRVESVGNLLILVMDNNSPDALIANFMALPKDANGIVSVASNYVELRTADVSSWENYASKLNTLEKTTLSSAKNLYYAVIPDKGYYLSDSYDDFLDHKAMTNLLSEQVVSYTAIDLEKSLNISNYYVTDMHWRQETLSGVLSTLGKSMNFTPNWNAFTKSTLGDYTGVFGRSIDRLPTETFYAMHSKAIDDATIKSNADPDQSTLYRSAQLTTDNPYGYFITLASPITQLKSGDANASGHLVLFADSYGNAIAPLLLSQYASITMVDLRYMASTLIPQYVNVKDADVLFLHSAAIVNNSRLLR